MNLNDLKIKISERISDYLEFNTEEIFDQGDYIAIFGGAVRDSIADMDINDVDIICMSKSAKNLAKYIIEKHDYKQYDLFDPDTLRMYKENSIIDEPWTFINKNRKIIQIIRPKVSYEPSKTSKVVNSKTIDSYYDVIRNVDISCCGVLLEKNIHPLSKKTPMLGEIVIQEAVKNSIIHCLTKSYSYNKDGKMFGRDRTMKREQKLLDRGWKQIDKNDIQKNRQLKLTELNFKPEYKYEIWTEKETKNDDIDDDGFNFFDLPF